MDIYLLKSECTSLCSFFCAKMREREGNEVLGYVDFWRRNFICLSKFFQKIFYPFEYFIKSYVCLSICFEVTLLLYVSFSNHQSFTTPTFNVKIVIPKPSLQTYHVIQNFVHVCFFLCPAALQIFTMGL